MLLLREKTLTCQTRSVDLSPYDYFVAAFSDGSVRVYKYPVISEKAAFIEWKAHKGSVVSVCITKDNQHLVTAGHDDGSIIVWRLIAANFGDYPPELVTRLR